MELEPRPITLHALKMMGEAWLPIRQTGPIQITKIVAEAWSPSRLQDARTLRAAGREPPPVKAVGYALGSSRIYDLSNGNHRTVAAREAGETHISANIAGEWVCDPAMCKIRGKTFLKIGPNGLASYWEDDLPDDLLTELVRLGVAVIGSPVIQTAGSAA